MTRLRVVLGSLALALNLAGAPVTQGAESALQRGSYLIVVGGCGDCHTPMKMGAAGPEPDTARLLSGHPQTLVLPPPPKVDMPWSVVTAWTNTAFAGPWGISYAINLTPDPDTGLGKWTEEQFVAALKTGRHLGLGRPILPPMPWTNAARMSDADLRSLWTYLRSIPPIRNRVPEPGAPPPAAAQPPATR